MLLSLPIAENSVPRQVLHTSKAVHASMCYLFGQSICTQDQQHSGLRPSPCNYNLFLLCSSEYLIRFTHSIWTFLDQSEFRVGILIPIQMLFSNSQGRNRKDSSISPPMYVCFQTFLRNTGRSLPLQLSIYIISTFNPEVFKYPSLRLIPDRSDSPVFSTSPGNSRTLPQSSRKWIVVHQPIVTHCNWNTTECTHTTTGTTMMDPLR